MNEPAAGAATDLYACLAEASLDEPRAFTDAVLSALRDRFDLLASSAYINSTRTETVRLRGQVGLSYRDYKDFDVPMDSFPGEAIRRRETIVARDLESSPLFRDKGLLRSAPLKGIVAVPLLLADESAHLAAELVEAPNPIGALCLYPRDVEQLENLARLVQPYASFIARLYIGTIERAAMKLRSRVVERVAYRKEIASLAYNYLDLALEELSVEAAGLWTLDARRGLLYRRKARDPRTPETPGDPPYVRVKDKSVIARCFQSASILVHDSRQSLLSEHHVDLKCQSPFTNWMAMPISLPADARLAGRAAPAAGVLELANHYTSVGGVKHLTTPNWEDGYLGSFSCELLSVLIYQVLRTQDHESDYERLLHGARTSIIAPRSHLQSLEGLVDVTSLPARAQHFIPNAIEWLEDFEAQLYRDDLVHKRTLELEEIALYGAVLAKLGPMVTRMNTRDALRPLELAGMDTLAQGFHHIPRVHGNRQALHCVFRNLLDNSRKYCQPPGEAPRNARIEVHLERDLRTVVIIVSDNGQPLPPEEARFIFEDGYRGEMAQGIQPQGVGRGLHTCQQLMAKMKGSISHVVDAPGVTFRLEMKVTRAEQR